MNQGPRREGQRAVEGTTTVARLLEGAVWDACWYRWAVLLCMRGSRELIPGGSMARAKDRDPVSSVPGAWQTCNSHSLSDRRGEATESPER